MLSVSQCVQILQCPRSAQFALDPNLVAWKRPQTTSQIMGTVLHEVFELIDSGFFDKYSGDEATVSLKEKWLEVCESHRESLVKDSTFGLPPRPEKWPNYLRNRGRAMERMRNREKFKGSGRAGVTLQVEEPLFSDKLQIRGRADRIEHLPSGSRIIDHKSGALPHSGIPIRVKFQMLLYAALYNEMHDQWPRSLQVQWRDGDVSEISIDFDEVKELLESIKDFQIKISLNEDAPAFPNVEVCSYCDFRAVCPEYLESQDRFDWPFQPNFLIGKVTQISLEQEGQVIQVDVYLSSFEDLKVASLRVQTTSNLTAIGDVLRSDRILRQSSGNYLFDWQTRAATESG